MRLPLVLISGIQGRPEYLQPAIDALSSDFDVIAPPLCGEPGCAVIDASTALDEYARVIEAALDERQIERAVVCGISFGGVVALRFAATRRDRVEALILASTPGPGWHLRRRHEFYARVPWLFGPLFLAESPFRLRKEIATAVPARRDRLRYIMWQLKTVAAAPLSVTRMAQRARLIGSADVAADSAAIGAPTLIITGEPQLDRIVPADTTREYMRLIPHASAAVLERTGHLGSITRPHVFARLIRDFVTSHRQGACDARATA